jgi:hypothetical protein
VANAVKAGFNVAFEDPFRTVPLAQQAMTLNQGIGTAAVRAEAIRVVVRLRFHDRFQSQQVQSLLGAIGHGGHNPSTLPLLPKSLWDS